MSDFSKKSFCIIACDVFKKGLEDRASINRALSCEFFKIGLHIHPDELRTELQKAIDECAHKHSPDYILLLCGLCGNATLGLKSDDCELVVPRMHDCISMFLGSSQKYFELKKKYPRAYFASSGWIDSDLLPSQKLFESQRKSFEEKYPDDEELVDELMDALAEQFKEYNCYFYTEFSDCPNCRLECEKYAKFMNWQFRQIESDPKFFEDAITMNWDERFLIVPKSRPIRRGSSEKILEA